MSANLDYSSFDKIREVIADLPSTVSSCTCGTKTWDPAYHSKSCSYWLITHIHDVLINALENMTSLNENEVL